MNELQMISELLEEAPPAERAVAAGRERLRAEIRQPSVTRRRRLAPPRWSLGMALAGATAAALAVTLTVTSGTAPRGPSPERSAAGQVQPQNLSARTVLLAAASQADAGSETTGAYWHTATISRHYHRVGRGENAYTIVSRERNETWTPSAPGGTSHHRRHYLGAEPVTPADVAAWRRAGSPSTFTLQVPIGPVDRSTGKRVKPMELKAQPGRPTLSSAPLVDGDKVFWLGRNVTMKDLRALPADPTALKAQLLKWYRGHSTEALGDPMSSDVWLFTVARGLIMDMPITPKVRGAAFRMLADLDSVRAVGPVRDDEGRTGTAVILTERTPEGTMEHRLIIDERRGVALGQQVIVVRPAGMHAALPAGSTLTTTSILTGEWTDTAPR